MKTKLFLLALLAALPLAAQQYQVNTLTLASNNVPTGVTSTFNSAAIGLTKYDEVGLMLKWKVMAESSSNVLFTFERSFEGSTNWGTLAPLTWSLESNGSTNVIYNTNLYVGTVGYLRLKSIANPNTAAITNINVKYVTKPKRGG